ncbi:MAG TPA: nuclear transport factor 2 family protein [Bacillales bacterium]|nr:nuclear transport factor 2 family protein [Bacillales bacterium]
MNKPKASVQSYFDALNQKVPEQMTQLFTDDATLMLNTKKTVIGKDAVKATYELNFANVTYGRVLHIDDVYGNEDLSIVHTHSTGTVTPNDTGEAKQVLGRELFVLQNINGSWRIRSYIFNHPKE